MTEHFLTYEQSLAVKQLGFDEPCFTYYYNDGKIRTGLSIHINNGWTYKGIKKQEVTLALLKSQFFEWVREKYNYQSSIDATADQHRFELGYNYWIWNHKTGEEYHTMPKNRPIGDFEYDTYEQAEDACIDKIIELIKYGE